MKVLGRLDLASIKRTRKTVATLEKKKATLLDRISLLEEELDMINATIDIWEEPVRNLTEGLTSKEYLDALREG